MDSAGGRGATRGTPRGRSTHRGGRGRGKSRGGGQSSSNAGGSQANRPQSSGKDTSRAQESGIERPLSNLAASGKAGNGATDGESEDDGEVCFICAGPVIHESVAPCNHRTCHICSLRMRALYKGKDCAHCRVSQDCDIHVARLRRQIDTGTICHIHRPSDQAI